MADPEYAPYCTSRMQVTNIAKHEGESVALGHTSLFPRTHHADEDNSCLAAGSARVAGQSHRLLALWLIRQSTSHVIRRDHPIVRSKRIYESSAHKRPARVAVKQYDWFTLPLVYILIPKAVDRQVVQFTIVELHLAAARKRPCCFITRKPATCAECECVIDDGIGED